MAEKKGQGPSASTAVQVVEVKPSVPITVRFLGPCQGLLTHWHAGRSHPCPGPGECPQAIHRARTVWRGYAPAEVWDESARLWRPGVQPITEALEEVLRGRTLRGEVWILARSQEGKKSGPLEGVYCERQQEECLSACFDILPVLLRFYHCSTLLLGVANPMPAKLTLEAAAGPAPRLPADMLPTEPPKPTEQQRRQFSEQIANLAGKRRTPRDDTAPRPPSNGHG